MVEQRRGNPPITRLTVHLVWVTKYRYQVLKGEIQKRCRELIRQICDAEDGRILQGGLNLLQSVPTALSKSVQRYFLPAIALRTLLATSIRLTMRAK